jgi:hypothetical protein
MTRLLRLLLAGYTIAALLAGLVFWAGSGLIAAGLTLWLGGAAAVWLLAMLQTYASRQVDEQPADVRAAEEALLAAALAQWEQDRLSDRPKPARQADSA